jgi:hypothetical protein
MRKLLLFVLSTATVVGGLYLLGAELLLADRIHFLFVIGGAMLTTLGVYLLWVDFVAPLLGVTTGEK